MLIIAESGGSKTDWRFLYDNGSIIQHSSAGMNPTYTSNKEMLELLISQLDISLDEPIKSIHFYGAGCTCSASVLSVQQVLNQFFGPCKDTFVYPDLLAAARSCSGTDKGIICILGTGSNACLYDGKSITKQMSNLGYLLGDEGSGAFIGKHLLKDFFEGNSPEALNNSFELSFPDLNRDNFIENVYKKPWPNKFLASFFPFVLENIHIPYCQELIIRAFNNFLERVKNVFPEHLELPIHFVGGVAFHSNAILRRVLQQNNLNVGLIVESPIAGLTLYHKKNK